MCTNYADTYKSILEVFENCSLEFLCEWNISDYNDPFKEACIYFNEEGEMFFCHQYTGHSFHDLLNVYRTKTERGYVLEKVVLQFENKDELTVQLNNETPQVFLETFEKCFREKKQVIEWFNMKYPKTISEHPILDEEDYFNRYNQLYKKAEMRHETSPVSIINNQFHLKGEPLNKHLDDVKYTYYKKLYDQDCDDFYNAIIFVFSDYSFLEIYENIFCNEPIVNAWYSNKNTESQTF